MVINLNRKKIFELYEKGYPINSIIKIIYDDCNSNNYIFNKPSKKNIKEFVLNNIKVYCLYRINKGVML